MFAEIISIGDELLIGQVMNTNASWMGMELNGIGVDVKMVTCVGDDQNAIEQAISSAFARYDLVLLTGGLGPTKDDITKHVLADFFKSELIVNNIVRQANIDFFKKIGVEMTEVNKLQAYVPTACEAILNTCGTAAGMWFEKDGKILISMPGVPYEMKEMMKLDILPRLQARIKGDCILHQSIMTHGIGESFLSDKIASWEEHLPANLKLAYLPSPGILRLRITAKGQDRACLEKVVSVEIEKLKLLIPEYIFAVQDTSLQEVVLQTLKLKGKSLSLAESCTGGYIAHLLTSISGSSEVFKGGIVAYSNECKVNLLGVESRVIEKEGVVSEAVVKQMAKGVLRKLRSDYAIAVSGVAGPLGGSPQKPVGTVWIAVADSECVQAQCFHFSDNRERNIIRAAMAALNMLLREFLKPSEIEVK